MEGCGDWFLHSLVVRCFTWVGEVMAIIGMGVECGVHGGLRGDHRGVPMVVQGSLVKMVMTMVVMTVIDDGFREGESLVMVDLV